MKNWFTIALILIWTGVSYGQEASLVWYESIGTEGDDKIITSQTDSEGNHYLLGQIENQFGNQESSIDIFIAKYSEKGIVQWTKTIGSHGNDIGVAMLLDAHNELLILASSNSDDGLFKGNFGHEDLYMFRISAEGELIKTSKFGGNFIDLPSSIIETVDGNYLITGHSRSNDGDLTSNKGQLDFWILKVDYSGHLIWQRNYGGSDEDYTVKAISLHDGNYMILGHSTSIDFDVPDNYGDLDISLMKLNANGDLIWQESYGGAYNDFASDIYELDNGNFLVAGSTFSNNIDISFNNGNSDGWIFEVTSNGDLIREKTFGSKGNDYIQSMLVEGNGTIRLLGNSSSELISDERNNGAEDIWLFNLNSEFEITNQLLIGGSSFENASSFALLPNDQILITGQSNSVDGIFIRSAGKYDGFIAKIKTSELNSITAAGKISVHPNPSNGIFYLNNLPEGASLTVYNQAGLEVDVQHIHLASTSMVDLTSMPSGLYFLELATTDAVERIKVIRK